jgi:hypothetical protein
VDSASVSPDIVARLRAVCRGLPECREEQAWVGTRWRVRGRTFAHVLRVESGRPPAHARAVGSDGPVTVVTFRAEGPELEALRVMGHPYFYAGWGREVVVVVLDDGADNTDWAEVAELVTESYCLLAPRALAERVARPG